MTKEKMKKSEAIKLESWCVLQEKVTRISLDQMTPLFVPLHMQ